MCDGASEVRGDLEDGGREDSVASGKLQCCVVL